MIWRSSFVYRNFIKQNQNWPYHWNDCLERSKMKHVRMIKPCISFNLGEKSKLNRVSLKSAAPVPKHIQKMVVNCLKTGQVVILMHFFLWLVIHYCFCYTFMLRVFFIIVTSKCCIFIPIYPIFNYPIKVYLGLIVCCYTFYYTWTWNSGTSNA